MKSWLNDRYRLKYEFALGRRRLDAALWSCTPATLQAPNAFDIALE
jgi:hypothetical protein